MDYTYSDYWNVPYQIPPDQYSSQPKGEMVRKDREKSSNTCFISQPQTGGQLLNKAALDCSKTSCNTSSPVFKNEVSRSPPTQYTRKCSTPPLAQYRMNDGRDVVHESSLEENNNYLFLNGNQLAKPLLEESRRDVKDASVNSEPTFCKPFSSVSIPKPALESSLMTNFWIPPPVKSAEQEGGCDKAKIYLGMVWEQNANDGISNHLFSTRLQDVKSQGNMKDSFVDDWTKTGWNSQSVTGDTSSKTPFALFCEHSATHDKLEVMDEFGETLSTNNAGELDVPSMTSPGKATQENLESVGWDYLFTADTHHSADYGDTSSGHPPPSSYTNFNANEIQYKGHLESGLLQETTEDKYTQKILHNDLVWKTPRAGTFHTKFENDRCHGGWFASNVASLSSDMTSRLPPPHWMPSEQTPPQALSTSFFTNHTEETWHEDLDVSELVDDVIKDVNTNNMELNHQPFTASTDQLQDRYGEAEWATSLPLNTSTHSMFQYQDFTSANEANYQTEDTRNVEQVSRYDVELDMCSQICWNRQTEVQTTFEDLQHPVEKDVFNMAPYSYNNREEESLGDEDEVANGEDDFDQYAKNITEDEKLFDDYGRNVDEATNEDKKTDDDKEMDKDEETNEDKTEETNQDKCTNDEDGRTDEYYNVVGEETGEEDTDEEIDVEVTEDEEFDDDDDDDEEEEEEDFNTGFEGDEEFDIEIDTSSELSVGEVDMDTDACSSHGGCCFSDQAITRSNGSKDIGVLAYLTSKDSSQPANEEMKDYSDEQFPNTIATDADEALCTIIEEDECSAQINCKEGITSSTISLDNQNRHDPSRTSLDVPEGDLECTAMYSEDITDADFDEINSGVTHTQEIPKVGYCTVYFILALFM